MSETNREERIKETRAREVAQMAYDMVLEGWPHVQRAMLECEDNKARCSIGVTFHGVPSRPLIKGAMTIPSSVKIEAEPQEGKDPDQMELAIPPEGKAE